VADEKQNDTKDASKTGADLGLDEVQAKADEELADGYRGVKVDPTPNEHYTVDGVLAEKPTPETDEDAAREAAAR
jgi:hypothetical protein